MGIDYNANAVRTFFLFNFPEQLFEKITMHYITKQLLVILLFSGLTKGQITERSLDQEPNTRSFSIYTSVGALELMAIGAQYQINDKFAAGVKIDICIFGSKHDWPGIGTGVGGKLTYYFDRTGPDKFLGGVNAINFEVTSMYPSKKIIKDITVFGICNELTIGRDEIRGEGIGFLWAVGCNFCVATHLDPIIWPALKAGIHWDF